MRMRTSFADLLQIDKARGDARRKASTQLKDLDVDRIDAVDKPATGRSFLLFKSKEVIEGIAGGGILRDADENEDDEERQAKARAMVAAKAAYDEADDE